MNKNTSKMKKARHISEMNLSLFKKCQRIRNNYFNFCEVITDMNITPAGNTIKIMN